MSRKQSFWVVSLFLLALLSSLVVNIPLRQVLHYVEIPAEIKMQGLHGTVTDGLVKVVTYQALSSKAVPKKAISNQAFPNQVLRLTDVGFQFQPLCLLKAAVCYKLHSVSNELSVQIEANLISQSFSISQGEVLLGSDVFNDIPQLLAQPRGQLAVSIDILTLVNFKVTDLVARVNWIGAGIQGEDQLLGNYNALIKTETDKLSIILGDDNSLLSVDGDIGVKWNGQYEVDLKFESRPTLNRSVISVLELATKRSGLNRFTMKKAGNLSPSSVNFLNYFTQAAKL